MAQMRHASSEVLQGWLFQKGKLGLSKKKKYFTLDAQVLSCSEESGERSITTFGVADAKVRGNVATLTITVMSDGKIIALVCPTRHDYDLWLPALTKAASSRVDEFYELGETLGEGAFAKVLLGVDKSTLEKVAVKIIQKADMEQVNAMELMHRELRIMKTIDHPNVIKAHDIFDAKEALYIVLEYMPGGTLADAMKKKSLRTERQVKVVMKEILLGVQYLHAQHIVHRDLKLKNILCKRLEFPLEAKLADFGLSNFVGVRTMSRVRLVSQVGSPHYVAPEVLREMPYGPPVDIWSCGVILHIMLTGRYPFAGSTINETLELVSRGAFEMNGDEWASVTNEGKDFICCLLRKDYQERITASQALMHPWLEGVLTYEPVPMHMG